jgi:hypothetical protein
MRLVDNTALGATYYAGLPLGRRHRATAVGRSLMRHKVQVNSLLS